VAEAVRLRRVRDRRETGLTLIEGPHLLAEALAGGVEVVRVFAPIGDEPLAGEWIPVTAEVLARLAPTEHPRGPVAVIRIPPDRSSERDALVLDVNDPGNAGSLIRSAAAFGLDVVFRPGSVDPWSPKVLRAGAGAHFRTRIGTSGGPGRGTIVTVVEGGVPIDDLVPHLDPNRRWDVVIGSEAHGVSDDDARTADVRVTIPMPGATESLNAAVAGGIAAYVISLWRRPGGDVGTGH